MDFQKGLPAWAALFDGLREPTQFANMAVSQEMIGSRIECARSPQREAFCRVVLTGFMGAGKSTVGQLLAVQMGWSFLDVDACIEIHAGTSAKDMFAALGEAAFRNLEADVLASCLTRSNAIIAPGGAAIDLKRNQQALVECASALVVFLDAPFATLIERCLLQENQGGTIYRPLLHKTELAFARYAARRPLYAARAHLTVNVADRSPDEIACEIQQTIERVNHAS